MIGTEYDVIVLADNYHLYSATTEGWDFENGAIIELTPIPGEPDAFSVTGQVTDSDSGDGIEGAKVECEVAGEPLEVYADDSGFYTLWLPVSTDTLTELQARASGVGYSALRQDLLANSDFVLEPQVTDPQAPQDVCEDGGGFLEGDCIVRIPADVLDTCYDLEIDPAIDVGDESPYTEHSVLLVEISLSGADLQDPIMLTIPYDIDDVDPGDFVNGIVVIYHAPTADDLREGVNVTAVPASDIIYEDHLNGLVCFWVRSLSMFGTGAPEPDDGDGIIIPAGGGGGGCFIATAAFGTMFEAEFSSRIENLHTSTPEKLTILSGLILLALVPVLLISKRRKRNNKTG